MDTHRPARPKRSNRTVVLILELSGLGMACLTWLLYPRLGPLMVVATGLPLLAVLLLQFVITSRRLVAKPQHRRRLQAALSVSTLLGVIFALATAATGAGTKTVLFVTVAGIAAGAVVGALALQNGENH